MCSDRAHPASPIYLAIVHHVVTFIAHVAKLSSPARRNARRICHDRVTGNARVRQA